MRTKDQLYPDFLPEIEAIKTAGISSELVSKIIKKHQPNATYNRQLYDRYRIVEVPIFDRGPRFEDEEDPINNKINHNFFGEIVDFKVGYFSGKPFGYTYSDTEESHDDSGGEEARDRASKALTDFTARNNIYDADMEATKFASICGYVGRLFYHNPAGEECVEIVPPFEAVILADKDITNPVFSARYFSVKDINDKESLRVEFYDDNYIYYYEGQIASLALKKKEKHNYLMNPLQGIPNNREMQGDAEGVLESIDAYDREVSDTSNELESFANAYLIMENLDEMNNEIAQKAQKSGTFMLQTLGADNKPKVYFVTKDVNDNFIEHTLNRRRDDIYRHSKTPNLHDASFGGTISGKALKYKLIGLEANCGMFQAKMASAGQYMFQLLAGCFALRGIEFDPLQCYIDFHRNFPQDLNEESQAVQNLVSAGYPKRYAYSKLSDTDDIEAIMQEIDLERYGTRPLADDDPEPDPPEDEDGKLTGGDDEGE